jgi:hypothetical protein|tara:strand:+ start:1068 stop:1184 length:117 start_codon:yes stop_codon:yes gene_type:complete
MVLRRSVRGRKKQRSEKQRELKANIHWASHFDLPVAPD